MTALSMRVIPASIDPRGHLRLHGMGARRIGNASITADRQLELKNIVQLCALALLQARNEPCRRAEARSLCSPPCHKIREAHLNVERGCVNFGKTCAGEERSQGSERAIIASRRRRAFDAYACKGPEERRVRRSMPGEIPHVTGDRAAGPDDTAHFQHWSAKKLITSAETATS